MNLIEHYVMDVLSPPQHHIHTEDGGGTIDYYTVHVIRNSYGVIEEAEVFCKTKEEAESVVVGYKYLA